ncbi:MAG: aminotransferase class I/II-fold pyridoxal phosphate-dependent enzyme [Candidatus Melainabacteria bacterium]|nr:MAG: aminotransferase class I/II-fold pyridoxal phosphate-dependent enzyme [Candidatus Melainabacteria bacterium]
MTQFTRTQNKKPNSTNAIKTGVLAGSLFAKSVKDHLKREVASFHTPGHKNNPEITLPPALNLDLTELPGLDELSRPAGTLLDLEKRISEFYSCAQSIVSVNGASAGLIAAILAAKQRKGLGNHKIVLPLNCHRAAIHALTLCGLTPVFYKPNWNEEWGIFTHVPPENLDSVLKNEDPEDIACVLIVSPSYSGDVSDVRSIARFCHDKNIPLIADEAHGAHLFKTSALLSGADISVQSWHKTLSALTQTGVVHVSSTSLIDADDVRLQMRLISTSSPSYLFLTSIDHATTQLEAAGASLVERVSNLTQIVRHFFEKRERDGFAVWRGSYRTDPWHMLVRPAGLKNFLEAHGVFPESNLGTGCLLMFGIGSTAEHVDTLLSALELFKIEKEDLEPIKLACPQIPEQVFSPRDVLYMPLETVPAHESAGRVAAECIAPCPPGFPLCVPGARIDSSFVTTLEKHTTSGVKVVVEK